MKKWIVAIIIVVVCIIGYNYIYQDHRDIESEKAAFNMPATEIAGQFAEDAVTSEQKYLNKTIEVYGAISEVNPRDITIDDKVFCQFSDTIEVTLKDHSKIRIKGRVIGFDDLLEQVKLDQCTILN